MSQVLLRYCHPVSNSSQVTVKTCVFDGSYARPRLSSEDLLRTISVFN